MRVGGSGKSPLKPGEQTTVSLEGPEGRLKLAARCVWTRRAGFRRWELGLEFVDIDRRRQRAVESLAMFGYFAGDPAASNSETSNTPEPPSKKPRVAKFEEPDHYAILHVARDADDEQIRQAFRTIAKQLHPDRNSAPDASLQFEAAKQAYDILRDPDARAKYDVRRSAEDQAA